jgi:hypothetical protein
MKFDAILDLIKVGAALAGTVVPGIAAGVDAGTRVLQIAHDAYISGVNRGEWTEAERKQFDTEILPNLIVQDHWMKREEPPTGG